MRTRTHFMITYVAICLCHHPWNLIIVINIKEAICDSYKKKKISMLQIVPTINHTFKSDSERLGSSLSSRYLLSVSLYSHSTEPRGIIHFPVVGIERGMLLVPTIGISGIQLEVL